MIVELGEYYGYPKCCIITFYETMGALGNPKGAEAGNYTGFIPCPKCADKVLSGELELKDLITNRICKKEFPKDDMDV